jgi:CheY-like chemotaxis protein
MAVQTAEQLAEQVYDLGLVDDLQMQQVWAHFGSRNVPVADLLQFMVRKEYLTSYQVERLKKGDKQGYFFGDYKVLYLVGAGSFARVFRAKHKQTGQVVAIKSLKRRYSENPAQYSLFVREGQLGMNLRHPNIVPIYEVFSKNITHYFVMEFVEGQSLRDFVRVRKKLAPLEATKLTIDICSGLRYAFEHGLTHRDLRMANVLVSAQGRAKLVDFGLAALGEQLPEDAENVNTRTIDYAALERATGVRKDDTRSDIYFVGCMFYHMLTGLSPLPEGRERVQRLNKQRFQEVVPITKLDTTLPLSVTIVVNKAMMLDVTKRYQSPAAMLTDLELVARRLAQEGKGETGGAENQAEQERLANMLLRPELQRTIMVVEANSRMQDLFREALKKCGYRVLVISDPQRAIERLKHDQGSADCLVIDALELGEAAVDSFNYLARDDRTQGVPAVLILGENQWTWRSKAKLADHRTVLNMPISMGQLRTTLGRLLPAPPPEAEGG